MAIRVCHVTTLHPYSDGRIFEHYCKSLAKKYEVYLLAPNTETRIEDNIHIIGVPLPTINQRWQRWMKLRSILKPLYEINADVYHFHDPELMGIGLKLKNKRKIVVFDSHEDILNQMRQKDFIPKPFRSVFAKLYGIYERYCLKRYDAVVSVTGYIVDRLKKINSNTYQITNYPIFQDRIIEDRKWDRTLCFAGLLSPYWMLNEIIGILPEVDATLYIAGVYSTEDYLNNLKTNPGWACVKFLGRLPHSEVIKLYNRCSIGIAIESYDNPNANYRTGSLGCTKIPDYMSSKLPIIVSNSDVWGGVVERYKCGIAVDNPKDCKEIAQAISYLLDHPDVAKKMGEYGFSAVKCEFNWESQEKIVFELYNSLLSKNHRND